LRNKEIVEKASESAHQWFVYFSQVMTTPGKQQNSLSSVKC